MTMTTEPEDKLARANEQGQAQFDSIVEMVESLKQARAGEDAGEAAEHSINEDALSVEVRGGWYSPGEQISEGEGREGSPTEYRILLCTGGPAVRIRGELSEHCEPETAHLEVLDWFTPWTEFWPEYVEGDDRNKREEILLTYARCFWFGE